MEFLSEFLPIIIYILLIIIIVVGIVLGIKLIITIDKIIKVVDDVNEKIEKVSPIFNAIGLINTKFSDVIETVVSTVESIIFKLFLRNKNEDKESEDNE